MWLSELQREIIMMNESLQSQLNSLTKLKVVTFKKNLKKKRDEIEEEIKKHPKNEMYRGELIAYDTVIKMANEMLNIDNIKP